MPDTPPSKARLDTTRLQKIAQAYWESAALMAGVELEIFTAIARGHDTIPTAAKAVGISERNAERLLTALVAMTLIERSGPDRSARFVCALAVARGTDVIFETAATVEGRLADAPAGPNGFGYDPVFYYPPYDRTFGEVSDQEKTAVSHRGQAMRAFRDYFFKPEP